MIRIRQFKLILMFSVILMLPSLLSAQVGVATVDTRVLLMLHPEMNNFDYVSGRFFRDQKEKKYGKVFEQLKTARKASEKEVKQIEKAINKIQEGRFKLVSELVRAQQFFAPGDIERFKRERADAEVVLKEILKKKPATTNEARLLDTRKLVLEREMQRLDNVINSNVEHSVDKKRIGELKSHIAEVDNQIFGLEKQIRELDEEAVAIIYLTTTETEAKMKTIKNEIQSLIEKAAKDVGANVVLDVSFAMRPQKRKKNQMIPAVEDSPDIVSSSHFHAFSNMVLDENIVKNLEMPENTTSAEQHMVAGRAIGLESSLKAYLDFRNYMPERISNFSGGRIFLTGGTDITPWVARQLFEKYNIPDSIKQRFMQLIRDYLNFEKEPFIRERNY